MINVALSLLLALSPGAATEIPKNFLLTEPAARTPLSETDASEMGWKISDKLTRPLELNPCNRRRAADAGRVAARTITYWSSAPSSSSEQSFAEWSANAPVTPRDLAGSGRMKVATTCSFGVCGNI